MTTTRKPRMTHLRIWAVLLPVFVASVSQARPFAVSTGGQHEDGPLLARAAATSASASAAGAALPLQSPNPPQQLVNAGLAGTIPVSASPPQGPGATAGGSTGNNTMPNLPQDDADPELYGGSLPGNDTDLTTPLGSADLPGASSPLSQAKAASVAGAGPAAGISGTDPSSMGSSPYPPAQPSTSTQTTLNGNNSSGPDLTLDAGSPVATMSHDSHGLPWPLSNSSSNIPGAPGSVDPIGGPSPFSALESDFPMYSEFADNKTDAVVHPYLAETDTIFSTDSDREYGPTPYESRYRALDDTHGTFDILKRWGSLSPYFSNPMYPMLQQQKSLPNHCSIQQVHMLHRPGARMPLDHPDEAVLHFKAWHSNATTSAVTPDVNTTFEGPLSFLNSWQYGLGVNELTRAGHQQMYDSGVHSFYRYGGLFNESTEAHKIVLRTTSASRMLDSAEAWAVGFFGFDGASKAASIEVEIEQTGLNSTLAPDKACPAAATQRPGTEMASKWINHYTERAVKRLQHFVIGASLTAEVVHAMQATCAYETYAMGMSDFCALFTRNEWDSFEYAEDLRFQGDYGFMSPTGRAQGIGWSQEFVARLQGTKIPMDAATTQNMTLDDDANAFPLDQRMYLDFGHDNLLVSVLTALNFTSFDTKLDPMSRDRTRNFIMSHISPFAARLFFEVLECQDSGSEAKQRYVRALLNDALLPMSAAQGCTGHPSQHDGLCPLDSFIKTFNTQSVPAANFTDACFAPSPTADVHASDLAGAGGPYPPISSPAASDLTATPGAAASANTSASGDAAGALSDLSSFDQAMPPGSAGSGSSASASSLNGNSSGSSSPQPGVMDTAASLGNPLPQMQDPMNAQLPKAASSTAAGPGVAPTSSVATGKAPGAGSSHAPLR